MPLCIQIAKTIYIYVHCHNIFKGVFKNLNSRPPRWGVRKWQKFLATFNFPPISSSTDDWSLCFNVSIKTIFDILDDGGSIKVWLLDCFCKRCNLSFIRRALRSGYTAPPVAVAKVMASQIKLSHNNNRNNFNMTNGKLSLFRISLLLETKLKKLMIGSTFFLIPCQLHKSSKRF